MSITPISIKATLPLYKLVVLISGSGSNLQAIIDAIDNGSLQAKLCLVISNKENAYGLERAKKANIETLVLDHTDFSSRDEFDHKLSQAIDQQEPNLVVLAGFMRILSADFVKHYNHRMINIHPSLLPKFKGLNTHQRAIDAGEVEHGLSIHYVHHELDSGPIIKQAKIPVLENDTSEDLAKRVLREEHKAYPEVIQMLAKEFYQNS